MHDRQSGITELVSVSSEGIAANIAGKDPAISADGRYVLFLSFADNLAENDNNKCAGCIRTRQNHRDDGTSERVF